MRWLLLGLLGGFPALRVLDVLPWAGFAVSYEYVWGRAGLDDMWSLRAGLRFGFAWRPSD